MKDLLEIDNNDPKNQQILTYIMNFNPYQF